MPLGYTITTTSTSTWHTVHVNVASKIFMTSVLIAVRKRDPALYPPASSSPGGFTGGYIILLKASSIRKGTREGSLLGIWRFLRTQYLHVSYWCVCIFQTR